MNKSRNPSPIELAAHSVGYSPAFSEAEKKAQNKALIEAMNRAANGDEASTTIEDTRVEKGKMSLGKRALIGAVASVGVLTAGYEINERFDADTTVSHIGHNDPDQTDVHPGTPVQVQAPTSPDPKTP